MNHRIARPSKRYPWGCDNRFSQSFLGNRNLYNEFVKLNERNLKSVNNNKPVLPVTGAPLGCQWPCACAIAQSL